MEDAISPAQPRDVCDITDLGDIFRTTNSNDIHDFRDSLRGQYRHLGLVSGVIGCVVLLGCRGSLGTFLGVDDGLEPSGCLEAGVIGVLLVKVAVRLGAQLHGEILEDAGEDGIDRVLFGGVTVPDGDEVGVEADGQADAAELVFYNGICLSVPQGCGDAE